MRVTVYLIIYSLHQHNMGAERLKDNNFATGLPEEQSAYRSELAGVLGGMHVRTCVEAIVKFYKLNEGASHNCTGR